LGKARAHEVQQHRRVVEQVAPRQAPRVLRQPKTPFQPGAPHPARRAPLRAGQKLQRRADAKPGAGAAGLQPDGVRQ